MADIKWIKISTEMFDNRKIKQIRKLPDGDAIIVVWVQILCLAGLINDSGMVYFTKDIPYTDEMLATEFDRPINLIRLALATFERFKMVEIIDDVLLVSNWEKYQSADKLQKIREQNRLRQQKYKEKQKQLAKGNVTATLPVTQSNATDIELELELELELDKEEEVEDSTSSTTLTKENIKLIINKWNDLGLQQLRSINPSTNRHKMLKARINEYSVEEIVQAIKSIYKSKFLKGQNKNNWVITFDWFIKPNNFIKVLEGNYLDKEDKGGDPTTNDNKDPWGIEKFITRG